MTVGPIHSHAHRHPLTVMLYLQFLPKGYTADTVVEGKAAARAELRKRWVGDLAAASRVTWRFRDCGSGAVAGQTPSTIRSLAAVDSLHCQRQSCSLVS